MVQMAGVEAKRSGWKPNKSKKRPANLPPSSVPGKPRFVRKLEAMTCWPQARDMLAEGYTFTAVAAFIQDEAGERLDSRRATLEEHLSRYRATYMPSAMFMGAAQLRTMGWLRRKMEDEELEFGRLEEMYRIQKMRIDQGVAAEQRMGVLLPLVGPAIREAIDTVCRMHTIKEAYGFNHGSKGTSVVISPGIVGSVQQRFGDEVAAVLQRPAARGRVLALLEEFRAVATDEDGDLYGGETIDITGAAGQAEAPAP
jgi:hypothetical protein